MKSQKQQHHPFIGEYKKLPHTSESDEEVDEFETVALAKRLGITKDEMLDMSFVSLVNILISNIDTESEKKATEDDVRRMFG